MPVPQPYVQKTIDGDRRPGRFTVNGPNQFRLQDFRDFIQVVDLDNFRCVFALAVSLCGQLLDESAFIIVVFSQQESLAKCLQQPLREFVVSYNLLPSSDAWRL